MREESCMFIWQPKVTTEKDGIAGSDEEGARSSPAASVSSSRAPGKSGA
jgi:hypothetical protein